MVLPSKPTSEQKYEDSYIFVFALAVDYSM